MAYFKRAEFWHRTGSMLAKPMTSSSPSGRLSRRPSSIRTTNALENLNREFRRRTKTQASFSSEESAVALLFGLIASGQIQLRRIDGYQRLSEVLEHAEVAA